MLRRLSLNGSVALCLGVLCFDGCLLTVVLVCVWECCVEAVVS